MEDVKLLSIGRINVLEEEGYYRKKIQKQVSKEKISRTSRRNQKIICSIGWQEKMTNYIFI